MKLIDSWKKCLGAIAVLLLVVGIAWAIWPRERFVPYNIQEQMLRKEVNGKTKFFIQGSFAIRSGCYLNYTTTGMYVIPVDADGKAVSGAGNILFYVPFNGENGAAAYNRYAWLRAFAEQYDFTVFSLQIKADTVTANDVSRYYIYQEAGWFDGIFKIQQFLQQKFNLQERKLFMIGQSSGCSMMQRMAAAMPEKIAAAAGHGGSRFADYTVQQQFPPFIFSSSSGDIVSDHNRINHKAAVAAKLKIWYMETPPHSKDDLHSAGKEAITVMTEFLLSAAQKNAGKTESFVWKFEQMPVFIHP